MCGRTCSAGIHTASASPIILAVVVLIGMLFGGPAFRLLLWREERGPRRMDDAPSLGGG